jgi:hypothetical protein
MGEVCDMQRSNKNGVSISATVMKGRLNWRVNLRTSYGSANLMVVLSLNLHNRTRLFPSLATFSVHASSIDPRKQKHNNSRLNL